MFVVWGKKTIFEVIQQTAKNQNIIIIILLKIPACKELSPCLPASSRLTGKNKTDVDKPQSLKENQYQSNINAMLRENLFLLLEDNNADPVLDQPVYPPCLIITLNALLNLHSGNYNSSPCYI